MAPSLREKAQHWGVARLLDHPYPMVTLLEKGKVASHKNVTVADIAGLPVQKLFVPHCPHTLLSSTPMKS